MERTSIEPNKEKQNRIESSPEITALLYSLLISVEADTAILYKFIDKEDLEGTEVMDLLTKHAMLTDNDKFFSDIIDPTSFAEVGGLKKMVEQYQEGKLDLTEEKNISALRELKNKIKVLRFCDLAERDPEVQRWDFSYRRRPPKYLVLDDALLNSKYRDKELPHEGVTAFFCRKMRRRKQTKQFAQFFQTKQIKGFPFPIVKAWRLSRDTINEWASHSSFGADATVFSRYDSHHCSWLLLGRKITNNGQVGDAIGCIRFEYYEPDKEDRIEGGESADRRQEKLREIATRPVVELIVNKIEHVMKKQKEQSYSEKYKCLAPLLLEVQQIGMGIRKAKRASRGVSPDMKADLDTLYDAHYLIEHLFYVLKRNTYYGDALLERVNRFIHDLLNILGLKDEIFGKVWEGLRRHEDLMLYSLDDYRDHLMHQFHVFILGYAIIAKDNFRLFTDLLNKKYRRLVINKKCDFTKLDVLRTWVLTSLFHDCGYAFERLTQGFETFSLKTIGVGLTSHFFWDKVVINNRKIASNLQSISSFYQSCPQHDHIFSDVDIFRILVNKAISNNDHGVISAIILMQQYMLDKDGYDKVEKIDIIMGIAAFAIAIHNREVYCSIHGKGHQKICLNSNPIAFLLFFCDFAQEWGRTSSLLSERNSATPNLRNLEIQHNKRSDRKNIFKVGLEYPANAPGVTPDANKIRKIFSNAASAFTMPGKHQFAIHYLIRSSRHNSFPQSLAPCGDYPACERADS